MLEEAAANSEPWVVRSAYCRETFGERGCGLGGDETESDGVGALEVEKGCHRSHNNKGVDRCAQNEEKIANGLGERKGSRGRGLSEARFGLDGKLVNTEPSAKPRARTNSSSVSVYARGVLLGISSVANSLTTCCPKVIALTLCTISAGTAFPSMRIFKPRNPIRAYTPRGLSRTSSQMKLASRDDGDLTHMFDRVSGAGHAVYTIAGANVDSNVSSRLGHLGPNVVALNDLGDEDSGQTFDILWSRLRRNRFPTGWNRYRCPVKPWRWCFKRRSQCRDLMANIGR
ncbi:hypothetical protein BJ322DRAFT_1015943 [Thelephora terrestris]|uniref:Uncharacterized protein n=1 Tax=Thelephora terrestris TaxID=56493 RepID=A0A9P6HNS4_9AGAM|nr:hypothetical protein BJ322DRAFT_1015943 [Thelephora terrestris]